MVHGLKIVIPGS